MTNLIEYKILSGGPAHCENMLNEWKEMYDLTILRMCAYGSAGGIAILLLRTVPQPGKEKAS